MTSHVYTFDPIVDDESPDFVSRLAVPAGGIWLWGEPGLFDGDPVAVSHRISWNGGEPLMAVVSDGILYVGPPLDLDLVLRPRRRGQRPAGIPRSAWWRMSRRERRRPGVVGVAP